MQGLKPWSFCYAGFGTAEGCPDTNLENSPRAGPTTVAANGKKGGIAAAL
jgi:hypothetical protein